MPQISEYALQKALCIWLDGNRDTETGDWRNPPALAPGVEYWHTPNNAGRKQDAALELKWSKEIGLRPGIHDLFFLRPTQFSEGVFGLLFGMEMKKPGGLQPPTRQLSDAQQKMHPRLLRAGLADSIVVDNLAAAKAWAIRHALAINVDNLQNR
jgi:hypothetical protein